MTESGKNGATPYARRHTLAKGLGRTRSQDSGKSVLKDFGLLTGGKTLGDVFTFVLFIALSRAYGDEGLGQYSIAIALTGVLVVFADFGLYELSVRSIARMKVGLRRYAARMLAARLILSISVFAVLLALLPILPFDHETRLVILVIGAFQLVYVLMDGTSAIFVARNDMHLSAMMECGVRAISAIAVVIMIVLGAELVTALIALPVTAASFFALALVVVSRRYGPPRITLPGRWTMSLLRSAIPFAVHNLLAQVMARVDVLMLGLMAGVAAAGIYNAAYRIVFLLMMIASFAAMAVLPAVTRTHAISREAFARLFDQILGATILLTVPAAIGLMLIAAPLILLFFGPAFGSAPAILVVLAWLLAFNAVAMLAGSFLVASDRQVTKTRCQWTATIIGVAGNLALIPLYGAMGAAVATLVAYIILAVLICWRLRDLISFSWALGRLFIALAASATFAAIILAAPPLPIAAVIGFSAIIYGAVLLAIPSVRRHELAIVLNLVGLTHRAGDTPQQRDGDPTAMHGEPDEVHGKGRPSSF